MRVKWDNVLCLEHERPSVWLFVTPWNSPCNSPSQNTGVGSRSLLQRIFPTQRSNPGFPHCRWILYQLNHQGSPRILEWVAYPFSSGSSQLRNQTRVSCIAGRFFTSWATREAPVWSISILKWQFYCYFYLLLSVNLKLRKNNFWSHQKEMEIMKINEMPQRVWMMRKYWVDSCGQRKRRPRRNGQRKRRKAINQRLVS